jgi:hypothetical protein
MSQPARERIVVQFRPLPAQLLLQVKEIAIDSAKVMFSNHSLDRMEERGITTLDVSRVLKTGDIKGDIIAGKNKGEWKCKITKQMKGNREVGVVTVVKNADRLFIKTVEWEDLK